MKKELVDKIWQTPRLSNARVCLRPFKKSDLKSISTYRKDPESCRYIRPPESDEKIQELVEHHCQPWQLVENRWNGFVVTGPDSDIAQGEVLFRIEEIENSRAEIGYRIAPSAMGKGYATEASRILIAYLFKEFDIHKVVAKCDPRNIASYRVMEKLGMVREAHFKNHI